jgi:large subunit ribosomal protein L18
MIKKPVTNIARVRKHARVRKKVKGTSERPRLNVYRSLTNIYAQVIDDTTGKTLVAASSIDSDLKGKVKYGGNKDAAKEVGKLVAQKAVNSGISKVVFDRGGYLYSGRVKELAEAAREAGLEF